MTATTDPSMSADGPPPDLPPGLLPAQVAVCRQLLAWGQPRPGHAPDLADRLQAALEERLLPAAAALGDSIFLSKSRVRALDCDGRWLDQQSTPFTWSTPLVAGQLVHRAIEVDMAAHRRIAPEEVVNHVVEEVRREQSGRADHLNGLDTLALHDLQAEAVGRVVEWRDLWPVLEAVNVRFEQGLRSNLQRGAVVIAGRPDLVVTSSSPRPGVATAVIVDLKTGGRNETAERGDLRLYALLWTLKYRQPPFRWATYYLAEGRWDVEEFDPALLEATVARLGRAAEAMVRLAEPPPDDQLQLHPGAHCRFCGRRQECPAAPETW